MKLLSDTHSFIWSFSNTKKLSLTAVQAFKSPANQIYLSVASVWEMQIKIALRKVVFNDTLENIIAEQQTVNGIQICPSNSSTLYTWKICRRITKTRLTDC